MQPKNAALSGALTINAPRPRLYASAHFAAAHIWPHAGHGSVSALRLSGERSLSGEDERGRADEALRESEERLRLAIEAAGLGIYQEDFRKKRSWWSRELYSIVGLAPPSRASLETLRARARLAGFT